MGDVFDPNDITVFTAVINPDEYKNKYDSSFLNNEYLVCLEIILENFAHFLEKKKSNWDCIFRVSKFESG